MFQHTDVALVGAGPIGLELAVALKRRGIEYLHFDAKQIGYTISWFAPQTRFFSSNDRIAIAGVPLDTPDQGKATREEYLAYLRSVARQFDLKVRTYEPVINIARAGTGFELTTNARGTEHRTRCNKLILVTGGTDRPRKLDIPGENLPHVSYYFQDPHTYYGRDLLIIGGKNSAVEAALRCHHAGARVTISYRREQLPQKSIKYWLLPEITHLIQSGKIAAHFSTVPVKITASHVTLAKSEDRGSKIEDGKDAPSPSSILHLPSSSSSPSAQRLAIPTDFILALIGYEQDNTLFKLAGLELQEGSGAPVFDEQTMESSVPNLYVAGTAVGGTQDKFTVFIENCHVHVDRILAALTGGAVPQPPTPNAAPES